MSDKKYIVMSKFGSSDRFMMEKAFTKRQDANTYAKLMMDTKEYDNISYYCFEQTMDYDFYFDVTFNKDDDDDDDSISVSYSL
jgi:hypothetical protein